MEKLWQLEEIDRKAIGMFAAELGVSPTTAGIIHSRGGGSVATAREFLRPVLADMPDPHLLLGVGQAVERLVKARRDQERICIYGDYDVDGISATALMVAVLRVCGFLCGYFIPDRFDDGYGLSSAALTRIAAEGYSLVVSVDCGITACAEADHCRSLGLDLIVVDHHAPKSDLPRACAVINPLQSGCGYPFKALAGVGVAFNLLVALRSRLRQEGIFGQSPEPDMRDWLDLVALGTIADVVSLTGQNRLYVQQGLKRLAAAPRTGIAALKRVAGIPAGVCSSGQVGFRLAPRLNAAGRLESAVPGVELLLSGDSGLCSRIAAELDTANTERQQIEQRILEEAAAMVEADGRYPDRFSIVLASSGWHRGVVGIVASRLAERYHRPALLLAIDETGAACGSGRSIPGFHLLDALTECSPLLERFGGHRAAAGVALPAERISLFRDAFETAAAGQLAGRELRPLLRLDGEVLPVEVTPELARELELLEPFGSGNPEPTLLMRRVRVIDQRVVGGQHLKLRLSADGCIFDGIAFRQGERAAADLVDLAFFPECAEWNGKSRLQLRIKDFRSVE